MFNLQKRCYAVGFAVCLSVVAKATDRHEQLAWNISGVISFTQDGFLKAGAVPTLQDDLEFYYSPEERALGVLWAAQYLPKTEESRREDYAEQTLEESFSILGLTVRDEGEGYLEVVRTRRTMRGPLLGVTLLLKGDWPHLKVQGDAHESLLQNCYYGGSRADLSMSAKHFPVAFSMRVLDKLRNIEGKGLNYGDVGFDSAYCVGLLRDLLTFSLTRTRILAGVSSELVIYKVAEIKNMMRHLMSYMKGSMSADDFANFCGGRYSGSGVSKFEQGLYAGLEVTKTVPIMEEKDERVITEVWEVVERGIKEGSLPVEEIKSWGRKLDDLFEKLGRKAGVDIPKGEYGPQFGAWLDYMTNGRGVYRILSSANERALRRKSEGPGAIKPFLRRR